MSRIDEWFYTAVGRGMNLDGAYRYQCADVANDYCNHLFGRWQGGIIGRGDAKDMYPTADTAYWQRIDNNLADPNLIPQRGDVIFWGASRNNPYGHVAVVESADTSGADVVEQDGYHNTTPAYRAKRGYVYAGMPCIGWLRPRPEKMIGYTPPIAKDERQLKVNSRLRAEPNTKSAVIKTLTANSVVKINGYVTNGELIDGDAVWLMVENGYVSRQLFKDTDLHDLVDKTPQSQPESPKTEVLSSEPEKTTSPDEPQDTERAQDDNQLISETTEPQEPSNEQIEPIDNNNQEKEQKMAYSNEQIDQFNTGVKDIKQLSATIADEPTVKEITDLVSKRTKVIVYFIGDALIGLGLVLPSLAVAFNIGTLQQTQALSSACATLGAFILTMFGIYKAGRKN